MILDIYKDSFEFASKKVTVLLLLGVLSFFGVLIIPLIFVYGYGYKVIKLSTQSMINGEDEPPEFGEYKKMFIDGLKCIIVYLAYMIIPIIIIAVSAMNGRINLLIFLIGLILMFVTMLISYLAIPLTYIGVVLISTVIFAVVALIISFIFGLLGVATLSFSTQGVGVVSIIGTIIFNFVLFFLVAPYLSMFKNRCQGLIYTLGS